MRVRVSVVRGGGPCPLSRVLAPPPEAGDYEGLWVSQGIRCFRGLRGDEGLPLPSGRWLRSGPQWTASATSTSSPAAVRGRCCVVESVRVMRVSRQGLHTPLTLTLTVTLLSPHTNVGPKPNRHCVRGVGAIEK